MNLSKEEVKELFEVNLDQLKRSAGHTLSKEVEEQALMQVLLYNKKLDELASQVTETEVELVLPDQVTPAGKEYTLMGVIDVVIDEDGARLYDFKTMDIKAIESNMEVFKHQINVYTYIWNELKKNGIPIVEAAIIATNPPEELKEIIYDTIDFDCYQEAISNWQPKRTISLEDQPTQDETLTFIGDIIDQIEENQFDPQPLERLVQRFTPTSRESFATRVCTNCDIRHSCPSFQAYLALPKQKRKRKGA